MYRIAACSLTLGFCAIVQGCATEAVGGAASNAESQSATISASSRFWRSIPDAMTAAASIDSVDGQKTKSSTSKVSVSPGHHTLSVTCRWGFVHNTQNLEVDARAGAHYDLGVVLGGGSSSCGVALEQVR